MPGVSVDVASSLTTRSLTFCVKVAINLDDDGIKLWLAALRNSTTFQTTSTPNLLQLIPHAMALLASNLDLLGKITFIVESYLFVDASLVLQVCSVKCTFLITDVCPSELFVGAHERSHECHAWSSHPDQPKRYFKLYGLYDTASPLGAMGGSSALIWFLQPYCENS